MAQGIVGTAEEFCLTLNWRVRQSILYGSPKYEGCHVFMNTTIVAKKVLTKKMVFRNGIAFQIRDALKSRQESMDGI